MFFHIVLEMLRVGFPARSVKLQQKGGAAGMTFLAREKRFAVLPDPCPHQTYDRSFYLSVSSIGEFELFQRIALAHTPNPSKPL